MSRRFRLLLLVVGSVTALLLLALYAVYLAAGHVPTFYRRAIEVNRSVLEKGSDRMLQQAAAIQAAAQKKARWQALITADEINGWLAVDMARNHPRALPAELRQPRVAIGRGEITVACRSDSLLGFVLSLTVRPYVPEPNVLAVRIVSARVGLLRLPLKQVTDGIAQFVRGMGLRLRWAHAGSDPVAMFSLPNNRDDGPPIEIEALRLGEGEIFVSAAPRRGK